MHALMLAEVVSACRKRQAEGDCPTTEGFSKEVLEDAVVELANKFTELEDRVRELEIANDERDE